MAHSLKSHSVKRTTESREKNYKTAWDHLGMAQTHLCTTVDPKETTALQKNNN